MPSVIDSGPSAVISKNVATMTVSPSVGLYAEWTCRCRGRRRRFRPGMRARCSLGHHVDELAVGDGDEDGPGVGVPGELGAGLDGEPGDGDVGEVGDVDDHLVHAFAVDRQGGGHVVGDGAADEGLFVDAGELFDGDRRYGRFRGRWRGGCGH